MSDRRLSSRAPRIRAARVHDEPVAGDAARVLVDRLWPRGFSKERAALDRWAKGVAPSTELRRWYGHEPERFEEFARRYLEELHAPEAAAALDELRALARERPVVLLTATRDLPRSGAAVLASVLSPP